MTSSTSSKAKNQDQTPKRPRGRPSKFTQALADEICERIASGESLRSIVKDDHMPEQKTVYVWLFRNVEFQQQYAKARTAQQERMADEILEIADDGRNDTYLDENGNPRIDYDVIQRSKLRVDTRKWLMSKLAPKKYGEKVDVNHGGQAENPLLMLLSEVQGTYLKPVDEDEDEG